MRKADIPKTVVFGTPCKVRCAGCFTNLDATRSHFNSIFDDITRSRVSVNGIYAGTIRYNIPAARYAEIETQLRAYAAANSLPYVWDNQVVNP